MLISFETRKGCCDDDDDDDDGASTGAVAGVLFFLRLFLPSPLPMNRRLGRNEFLVNVLNGNADLYCCIDECVDIENACLLCNRNACDRISKAERRRR